MSFGASAIDPDEVARFSAWAAEWWDPRGRLGPLHALGPVRLAFIREEALKRFGRDPAARAPFAGLRLIDIGCGGGLLAEPMARLGFSVTGIDPSERAIAVAQAHARASGLSIDYRASAIDAIGEACGAFDLVLNMEVIEHTPDPGAFLVEAAGLLAPGGLMVVASLNRTLKSLALAKIGAEYLLRWLPVGTHDWRRFVTPDEIRGFLAGRAFEVAGPFGVAFDLRRGKWSRSSDCAVNYLMTVGRPA